MDEDIEGLKTRLRACRICSERFLLTRTQHAPRPIVWFRPGARILIASQAPGARAHDVGEPFRDPSGVRLRDWLGLDEATFYDRSRVAIVPMAFCFPGYDANGSDLPPPRVCAETWRANILSHLPSVALTLLIGGYAQKWHLGTRARDGVTKTVAASRDLPDGVFALPHPSWRNTAWLKKNQWFEADMLPMIKARVAAALGR